MVPRKTPGHPVKETDPGLPIILPRKDDEVEQQDDEEYVPAQADRFGSLRSVLPGRERDEGRTANVHDSGCRRVQEEMLLALFEIRDLLLQGR